MQPQTVRTNMTGRTKAALWLLVGPTGLFFASIILFFLTNLLSGGSANGFTILMNIVLFLAGAIVVISWLPGIIIGIILLTTAPKN